MFVYQLNGCGFGPRCCYNLSVDFNIIDNSNIIDIHKYLIKKTRYKVMFKLILKMFIELLTSAVNASNHATCALLSNQQYITQPTLTDLHPAEDSQGLR